MKKTPVKNVTEYVSKRGSTYEIRNINGHLECFLDGKRRPITKEISDLFYAEREKGGKFTIFADGRCTFTPGGLGAFGCLIRDESYGETTEVCGGVRSSTTNRMLIKAMIESLKDLPDEAKVQILTRNDYAPNIINGRFRKRSNHDLWAQFDQACEGKHVFCEYSAPGENVEEFKKCDRLINEAMRSKQLDVDKGYDKGSSSTSGSVSSFSAPAMSVPIHIENDADKSAEISDVEKYAKENGVSIECAKSLKAFWNSDHKTFQSYASLRSGGTDRFSDMSEKELFSLCEDSHVETLKSYLSAGGLLTAVRWHLRGLSLTDSIRKTLVGREIAKRMGGK